MSTMGATANTANTATPIKNMIPELKTKTGVRPMCISTTATELARQLGPTKYLVWKNKIYQVDQHGTVNESAVFTNDDVADMMDTFDLAGFSDYIETLLQGGKAMWRRRSSSTGETSDASVYVNTKSHFARFRSMPCK